MNALNVNRYVFDKVVYGRKRTIAIDLEGNVYVWGNDYSDGIGFYKEEVYTEPTLKCGLKNIVQVAAGTDFSIALDKDGNVWAWGKNSHGLLCNNSEACGIPVKIELLKDVVQIAAGHTNGLALLRDGTVWLWGEIETSNDDAYEYGYSDVYEKGSCKNEYNSTPSKIWNLENIISIAFGERHFIALKSDGTVWSWGSNRYGQLGDSEDIFVEGGAYRVTGLCDVKEIVVGSYHNFAIKENGEVWGWGSNKYKQIKEDGKDIQYAPVLIDSTCDILQVSAGYSHTIARMKDGRVIGWGDNRVNQLHISDYYSGSLKGIGLHCKDVDKVIDVIAGYKNSVVITSCGEEMEELGNYKGQVWACGDTYYINTYRSDNYTSKIEGMIGIDTDKTILNSIDSYVVIGKYRN